MLALPFIRYDQLVQRAIGGQHGQNELVFIYGYVDQVNAFRFHAAGKGGPEFLYGRNALSLGAEGLGQLYEIRAARKGSVRVAPAVKEGLHLPYHTQRAVVEHHDHEPCAAAHGGGKLVQIHAEAAVPGDQYGFLPGGNSRADGSAHAVAHGAQTPGGNESAGLRFLLRKFKLFS